MQSQLAMNWMKLLDKCSDNNNSSNLSKIIFMDIIQIKRKDCCGKVLCKFFFFLLEYDSPWRHPRRKFKLVTFDSSFEAFSRQWIAVKMFVYIRI